MDKYVSVALVVAVFVLFEKSSNIAAIDAQKLDVVVEDCKVAEKATDTDFLNLKMNVKPRTRSMKCLATCLSEKYGKISKNKLNPEGLLTYVQTLPNYSEKNQQNVQEIIEECQIIQDDDRCEFGSKLMDCLIDGSKKRGIKMH